jgi:hypothetical protein
MNVKYNCETWRWQFDWHGVSEAEAAKHGYRGLPRPVAAVSRRRPRWNRPQIKLVFDGRAAKAALRVERAAAARERRLAYYRGYWLSTLKARRAARRALA